MVSTLIRVGGGGVGEKWHLHCKSCCWGEGEMVSTRIRVENSAFFIPHHTTPHHKDMELRQHSD